MQATSASRLGSVSASVMLPSRALGPAIAGSFRSRRATLFEPTPSLAEQPAPVKLARPLRRRGVEPSIVRTVPLVERWFKRLTRTVLQEFVDGPGSHADVFA